MKYLEFKIEDSLDFMEKTGIAINVFCTTKAYMRECMNYFRVSVAS